MRALLPRNTNLAVMLVHVNNPVNRTSNLPIVVVETTMCTNFPCNKQPFGSMYCGYYICEHGMVQERYTTDPELVRGQFLLGIDAYICVYYFLTLTNTCFIFLWIQ